jgi:hypothetical protein
MFGVCEQTSNMQAYALVHCAKRGCLVIIGSNVTCGEEW